MTKRAFAIVAHPDDIEFMMAGTLILLGQAGYEIHYMTVANGSCGTDRLDVETIVRIRRQEAIAAAARIGAVYHESLVNDIEILYTKPLLQRLGAVVRKVAPEIILTHAMPEYMEDHTNTCRLVLTAAFTRGMPNFAVRPPRPPVDQPVTVYHALPYGLRDPLGRRVYPGMYVDVSAVMGIKREMLAMHESQKAWLDASQGLDSYLIAMQDMCREVGRMSGRFTYAEGWTRHLHLGYCDQDADPLAAALPEVSFAARPVVANSTCNF
jgi:LmbE family N-acetylglucosaminyl deacetylase